jgi:hypothetical protein
MRALRAEVERHDVFWWAGRFLGAALRDVPGAAEEEAEEAGLCSL